MKYFETVIIGGGPAGASAGILLARRGEECCIIDKHSFPREKTCGGLLSQKTLDILSELNLNLAPESFYLNKTNRIRIANRKKIIATFDCKNNFYLADRKIFDHLLINEYKNAGGIIFENEKAIDIDFREKTLLTDRQKIKYNYLICADGSKSLSDKLIKKKNFGITIEADIPADFIQFDNHVIHLDFGLNNDGYGWIFPKNEFATVGFGCTQEKGKNYRVEFKKFLADCGVDKNVPVRMKGATLPFEYSDGKAVFPEANILLVGDAAGMVDSLTGEGIYFALKSGTLAANAIAGKNDVLNTYQESCTHIFDIVNKSHKIALTFYKYRKLFLVLAKNREKKLANFCDNELAYYKYGYNNYISRIFHSLLPSRLPNS